jgi:hypothetical protein
MGTSLITQDEFRRKVMSVFPEAVFGPEKYTFTIKITSAAYAAKRDRIVRVLDEVIGYVFFLTFKNDELTLSLNE